MTEDYDDVEEGASIYCLNPKCSWMGDWSDSERLCNFTFGGDFRKF